jgi:RNA polymerase sigma-70 factor (ECF subfamily)
VALTLRLIAGLTPAEVAAAFLVSDDTMAKRLVRAKYKIKAAKIPYRIPDGAELPRRLRAVLSVLYLIYNAGAGGRKIGHCSGVGEVGHVAARDLDEVGASLAASHDAAS